MKKLITILILATLPIFAGCNSFNPEQAKKLAELADKVVLVTEELQESVVPMIENLNAQGIVSDADTANIKKISDQIDKVQVDVVAVSEGIKTIQSDGIQGIIEGGRAVNAVIPSPYQNAIDIALLALAAVAGLFAKKKSSQALLSNKALTQTVAGVQKAKDKLIDAEAKESINIELSRAQDQDTKAAIALIKSKA